MMEREDAFDRMGDGGAHDKYVRPRQTPIDEGQET